ncbi:MAG: hypothetical protein K2H91_07415 [Lachnospiraceae bacterium]|nr:hypothetical protein [Lachnospiraceae bacterium]
MKILDLDGKWELRNEEGEMLCPVEVPGTVIAGLFAAGKIEDPYYRENEYKVRELFWKDYQFVRSFAVEQELMRCLLYTSPSPLALSNSTKPSSA